MKKYHYLLKLVIVGDSSAGKSCLFHQFIQSEFNDKLKPTMGVGLDLKTIQINNKNIKLWILDLSGLEAYKQPRSVFYKECICGIIVFDVTSRLSFEHVQRWLNEIQEIAFDNIQLALVANKTDLNEKCEVSNEEAQAFAKNNRLAYFETSAKTGDNVYTLFEYMAQSILNRIDSGEIDPSKTSGIQIGNKIDVIQKTQTVIQVQQDPKPLIGNTTSLGNKNQKRQNNDCC